MYTLVKLLWPKDSREDVPIIKDEEGNEYMEISTVQGMQHTTQAQAMLTLCDMAECREGFFIAKVVEAKRSIQMISPILDVLVSVRDQMALELNVTKDEEQLDIYRRLNDMIAKARTQVATQLTLDLYWNDEKANGKKKKK